MADDSFSSLLPLIAETTEKLSSGNTQEASKAVSERLLVRGYLTNPGKRTQT